MEFLGQGLAEAIHRLVTLDADVVEALSASLVVSGTATALSVAIGVPAGTALGLARFRGRGLVLTLVNTGLGLPPVVVGLFVAIFLWRSGPLGDLNLYCTRQAMVIAQLILGAPTVLGLTAIAVQSVDPMLRLQLRALGATPTQALWLFAREARLPILTAAMAGFGAVISEIGASLMVGCNVKGDTRILTTAITLETGKGEFGTAIALGIILLALVFAVNAATTWAQQRSRA
ncbi:MAG: ABC transporter permease subunit [Chloroflexi bacterium]|nr:MAG: ABC transporter permease subunit [Chloroflexota bacterium]